jgi:hypothetical protein
MAKKLKYMRTAKNEVGYISHSGTLKEIENLMEKERKYDDPLWQKYKKGKISKREYDRLHDKNLKKLGYKKYRPILIDIMQTNVDYVTGIIEKRPEITLKEIITKAKKDGRSVKAIRKAFEYWIAYGDVVVVENVY